MTAVEVEPAVLSHASWRLGVANNGHDIKLAYFYGRSSNRHGEATDSPLVMGYGIGTDDTSPRCSSRRRRRWLQPPYGRGRSRRVSGVKPPSRDGGRSRGGQS